MARYYRYQVAKDEATDENGALKDGYSMSTQLTCIVTA
jgi:hypothetical protein